MLYNVIEFIKDNKIKCLIALVAVILGIILIVKITKGKKKEEGPVVGPPPVVHSEMGEDGEFVGDEFDNFNEEIEVEEQYLTQGVIY